MEESEREKERERMRERGWLHSPWHDISEKRLKMSVVNSSFR